VSAAQPTITIKVLEPNAFTMGLADVIFTSSTGIPNSD
jgi:hypothetical protein